MRVNRDTATITFHGEDDQHLRIGYDNRGEPYREGFSVDLMEGYESKASVFLEAHEGRKLRDFLIKFYGG